MTPGFTAVVVVAVVAVFAWIRRSIRGRWRDVGADLERHPATIAKPGPKPG